MFSIVARGDLFNTYFQGFQCKPLTLNPEPWYTTKHEIVDTTQDIFSMNQHHFADLTGADSPKSSEDLYETMLEALTQSIKIPGCMLLALIPHQQPAVLSRAWCLYEPCQPL